MAKTKDIFAPLMTAAKALNLPTAMIQEVFEENDTSVCYNDEGPRYRNELVGDNWIELRNKIQLDVSEKKLALLKDKPGAPSTIGKNEFWPHFLEINCLYNEMFHAWWDQIFEHDSKCRWLYDWVISKYAKKYNGNLKALEECWSETADKYIDVMVENKKIPYQFEWIVIGLTTPKFSKMPNRKYELPPTGVSHSTTKQSVMHPHRFGLELSKVEISKYEWTILELVLKKGGKNITKSDLP